MNQQQIFNFESKQVRIILVNDEPFFVGKDVAEVLGYSNTAKAIRDHVDVEDRRSERIVHPLGGKQDSVVINESGLYSLILSSKMPNAKKFKRWVTSEVLPTIRKHGAYMTDETLAKAITSPEFGIMLLTELKNEREQKEKAQQQLKAQEPQVIFAKTVEVSQNSVAVKVLATILKQNGMNIGQNRMFSWLREHKYLSSRQGKTWNMPTQKAMEKGLFELKANTYFHNNGVPETNYTPLVTGKGQIYFINKFKNEFSLEVTK